MQTHKGVGDKSFQKWGMGAKDDFYPLRKCCTAIEDNFCSLSSEHFWISVAEMEAVVNQSSHCSLHLSNPNTDVCQITL